MPPPLYPHQLDIITKAIRCGGSLAIFAEPGLGKTRAALEILLRLREQTPTLRGLVICPLSIIDAVWGSDIETFTTFRWCALKRYDRSADIVLVNYEVIIRSSGWRLLRESGLLSTPVLLVVDESSRLKDHRSLTTKTMLTLAKYCQHRLVLSGTPTPNGLHEIHGQIRVVDPNCVPRSFSTFQRDYFYLARGHRTFPEPPLDRDAMHELFRTGWEWRITDEKRDQLLARIAPICSWVRKADAVQLPERITTIRHVTLSPAEQRAYDRMKRELVVEFEKETVTAEIALTRLVKLRQIVGGFLYGEHGAVHSIGQSKLRLLEEVIEELGPQPIVIWATFRHEIEMIAAWLTTKYGPASVCTLYGGTEDKPASIRAFQQGDTRYLVAHGRSAAHGLTLVQASCAVYFSLDFSLEMYTQSQDRLHRIGTTKSVLYVHLIAPQTIDEDIWEVLQQKRTLQEVINAYFKTRRQEVLVES